MTQPGVGTVDSQSYISVMGCLMEYQYIEVLHSGTQILIAVSIGVIPLYTHTDNITGRVSHGGSLVTVIVVAPVFGLLG